MAMKMVGILTVIFGLIVMISPWMMIGTNLQYLETVMGVLVLIIGAMNLK